jgi:hypothetical protein
MEDYIMSHKFDKAIFILAAFLLLLTACKKPAETTTPVILNSYQLEYRLFAEYDVFWCDPDFYPIARPGSELGSAIAQFPSIQANLEEFSAILNYLSLDVKDSYSDDEKLLIYRQHKKLTFAVQMTAVSGGFDFVLRTGQNQGWRYDGNITSTGVITIKTKATSFNTCPICLAEGTLIDTPVGAVPVEQLKQGMIVWTTDAAGNRIAAPIIKTSSTPVPYSFQVVKIVLADGRTVTASPGHPSADFKAIGDYAVGNIFDGSKVVSIDRIPYSAGATYDILPAGGTGLYWANGILLLSTLF